MGGHPSVSTFKMYHMGKSALVFIKFFPNGLQLSLAIWKFNRYQIFELFHWNNKL